MDKKNQGDYLLSTPSKDKWKKIGVKRRSGILAPLFSVYSKKSIGIADFSDLKLLIDFSKLTGNSILQLLPMNEVGGGFCPYDAVSAFAIEPAYLSLEDINFRDKKIVLTRINNLRKKFPIDKEFVNYQIKAEKINLLWEIFFNNGAIKQKDLENFVKENVYWLDDFSLYKVLKKYNNYKGWYDWPDELKNRDKKALEEFKKSHQKEIDFEIWLQYLCFKQFKEAKEYANSNDVFLKGDLPILVSKDSACVWAHPDFFKLNLASGAPPDVYAAKGQRWGMPTYNWENIAKDDFNCLKNKLKYAENFYDILRIDHVVGLFRIWSIPCDDPLENQGLNGFFDPKDEGVWHEHGKNILSTIVNNTSMLICAEDLGVIPSSCPKTMEELGICGNDVARWVKDWAYKHDFLNPSEYRFLSVSMLSTHDTTNFCAWWEFEAGTIDEALFKRKCASRNIDFKLTKNKLFDSRRSSHGRLRWLDEISSVDILLWNLAKPKEEVEDFIELYQNTYREKEKFWAHIEMNCQIKEQPDKDFIEKALDFILKSNSIFSIQLLIDWLYLTGIFKESSYKYRINTPGTVTKNNWSLVLPVSLDELLKHKVYKKMKELIKKNGR